jgi:pimeloyl-ACP methyl ester carboxylesterase
MQPELIQSADGTKIALEKSGAGPALVLVSGALSDRRTAAALRPLLDSRFQVVAYDRRGRAVTVKTARPTPPSASWKT